VERGLALIILIKKRNTIVPTVLHQPRKNNTSIHRVSKHCAKLILSELSQISTNFDNFWQKDGKEARIM